AGSSATTLPPCVTAYTDALATTGQTKMDRSSPAKYDQSWLPSVARSAVRCPLRTPAYTTPSWTAGGDSIASPRLGLVQRRAPVVALSARILPCPATYTVPPERTGAVTVNEKVRLHRTAPVPASSARSVRLATT